MGNQFKGRAEHSAECFGDTRDDWNWSEEDTRRFFLAGGGVGATSTPTSLARWRPARR